MIFFVIIGLKTSISYFSSPDSSFFSIFRVFFVDLLAVVTCFVTNLLQRIVMSSMISFFISFCVDSLIRHSYSLTCYNNLIIFTINLDIVSFSKYFNTFNYVNQ